ncbi:MAG: bifunctional pyr operon transcriptional regulator/uracil phosphoribosyltransferase PyrR [Flavobacteriales bacterium]
MKPTTLIDPVQFKLIINRLCFELIENHIDFSNTVFLGVQPRGVHLAERIQETLQSIVPNNKIEIGALDITFFRDDFRRRNQPLSANSTDVPFIIEGKNVILVDDVLYTGRTIRAALDGMLAFGRPSNVELLVLIDRRFSRELPIEAKYIGKTVDSIDSQRVTVEWAHRDQVNKDKVVLHSTEEHGE